MSKFKCGALAILMVCLLSACNYGGVAYSDKVSQIAEIIERSEKFGDLVDCGVVLSLEKRRDGITFVLSDETIECKLKNNLLLTESTIGNSPTAGLVLEAWAQLNSSYLMDQDLYTPFYYNEWTTERMIDGESAYSLIENGFLIEPANEAALGYMDSTENAQNARILISIDLFKVPGPEGVFEIIE